MPRISVVLVAVLALVAWVINTASLPILALGTLLLSQCSFTALTCTAQLPRLDVVFVVALLASVVPIRSNSSITRATRIASGVGRAADRVITVEAARRRPRRLLLNLP